MSAPSSSERSSPVRRRARSSTGSPGGLFLTLVGITYLFALAQNNGTIDWLVRLAVRAVRGRIAAIPWIMFGISAVLTSVGAVSPGAVAIIAPIALGFAFRYQISPLLMGLMVVHGAQAGGFSPISIYGGITNGVVAKAGLAAEPDDDVRRELLRQPLGRAAAVPAARRPQPAPRPVGSAGGGQRAAHRDRDAGHGAADLRRLGGRGAQPADRPRGRAGAEPPGRRTGPASEPADGGFYQIVTLVGLAALAVLVLAFKLDIGFVSLTIGLVLSLMAPTLQKRAMTQVAWPEIMLITGVSTYVAVLEAMGTITFVGDSVAGLASPLLAALLLCFIGAVVSAFASSTAVLGSLIPLAVPFLQAGTGVSAIGFIAAMAVASTIVDVSPFSTNGALVLANAQGIDRQLFFRRLLGYGAIVTVLAPIVVWLIFVVLPG